MACQRSAIIAVILIEYGSLAVVVERPEGTTFLDPSLDPLALFGRHPPNPTPSDLFLERRLAHDVLRFPGPVDCLIVAVRKSQTVPIHDQNLIALQVLVAQQLFLICEINRESGALDQRAGQRCSDIVRVMRLVAAQGKCSGSGSCKSRA